VTPLEPYATDKVSAQYEIPEAAPFISYDALKARIRHHYELASDYYYSLWYAIDTSPPLRKAT
jgi:hypothetical protein